MTPMTLEINTPILSVQMMDAEQAEEAARKKQTSKELQQEKERISSICSALKNAVDSFNQFNEDLFMSHKEQIVKLSIEIASRILAKDVKERNYDIEKIITEALQSVPATQQITVRLNPDDLKVLQELIQSEKFQSPENVQFMGDWGVGNAECIVETDSGIIEYLIDEHVKQIAAALLGPEAEVK